MTAPLSINEDARLDALHQFNILDTLPSSAFDDITELAAQPESSKLIILAAVPDAWDPGPQRWGDVLP